MKKKIDINGMKDKRNNVDIYDFLKSLTKDEKDVLIDFFKSELNELAEVIDKSASSKKKD